MALRDSIDTKRWRRRKGLLLHGWRAAGATLFLAFAAAGPAGASDGLIASPEPGWPQWRGPRRDGVSEERGLLAQWPAAGPKLAWKADGLGTGWSSPIVVGEGLYVTGDVGDDLVIFAFDRNGTQRWRTTNGRAWKGPYPGARASCSSSGGRLYHLNAHGRLACLDAASGREVWAADVLDRFGARNITWGLSECLLVDGPRVFVTPGGTKALMAALDAKDGATVWVAAAGAEDRATHASSILFRHAGRRLIAACSSAHGLGVDADTGALLWKVPLRNEFGVNAATPVYGSGRVFYVTPYAELGRLYRLRPNGEGFAAEEVWVSSLDVVTGGAILVGETLVAAGYKSSKWWFGVDWETGKTTCETKEFTTGAAVWADGRVYCLDERGTVGLLALGPEGFAVAGSFRLVPKRVNDAWAHPVILDGRLYLRYHDTLWCYDVRDSNLGNKRSEER
jgi:outer membrane protein assembly factor BamB